MFAFRNGWLYPLLAAGWIGLAAPCLAEDSTVSISNDSSKPWTFQPVPIPEYRCLAELYKCGAVVTSSVPGTPAAALPADSRKSFIVPANGKVKLDFGIAGSHGVYRRWYLLASGQTKPNFVVTYYRKAGSEVGMIGYGVMIEDALVTPANWNDKVKFKGNTMQIVADGW